MKRTSIVARMLALLAATTYAHAQAAPEEAPLVPPPPPIPAAEESPAATPADDATPESKPADEQPAAAPAAGEQPADGDPAAADGTTEPQENVSTEILYDDEATALAEEAGGKPSHPDPSRVRKAGNTLDGTTGLLRVVSADSGAQGTFRLSLIGSFYSGSGFLCPDCSTPNGTVSTETDDVGMSAQRWQLSVTPLDFLEAYAALRFQQTSNDQGDPEVIQISGDPSFGAKAFLPPRPNDILMFGGGATLWLLSRTGGVGPGAANVLLNLAGTLDLARRPERQRIPLRAHLNLGYLFDSSDAIVSDVESERTEQLDERQRITRIERFGYDINRVDTLGIGLGVEGVYEHIRPFAEWTLEIPVNRQDYLCRMGSLSEGDQCLSRSGGLNAMPSRLTIGARAYPRFTPATEGLSFLAALDVGTGATSSFLDEVAPELPWSLHLGVGYAFDTRRRIKQVTKHTTKTITLTAPSRPYVVGTVTDAREETPIAQAMVLVKDTDSPGMLTNSEGKFQTRGRTYVFTITKEGYETGECEATLREPAPPAEEGEEDATADAADEPSESPRVTEVSCELTALSTKGRVEGVVRDAETTEFVEGASVRVTDQRGRSLTLQTDDRGAFRFDNVPAGTTGLHIELPGYLPAATMIELIPRDSVSVDLRLHKRPRVPRVVATPRELKLTTKIRFLHGSAELMPESQGLIEDDRLYVAAQARNRVPRRTRRPKPYSCLKSRVRPGATASLIPLFQFHCIAVHVG